MLVIVRCVVMTVWCQCEVISSIFRILQPGWGGGGGVVPGVQCCHGDCQVKVTRQMSSAGSRQQQLQGHTVLLAPSAGADKQIQTRNDKSIDFQAELWERNRIVCFQNVLTSRKGFSNNFGKTKRDETSGEWLYIFSFSRWELNI